MSDLANVLNTINDIYSHTGITILIEPNRVGGNSIRLHAFKDKYHREQIVEIDRMESFKNPSDYIIELMHITVKELIDYIISKQDDKPIESSEE